MLRLPHPLEIRLEGHLWLCRFQDKELLTPQNNPLHLPSEKMARALQKEAETFAAVKQPDYILWPRICNVIDNLKDIPQSLDDKILAFTQHDLLCYRANYPQKLRDLEDEHWQCRLDWAKETLGIDLPVILGIGSVELSPDARNAVLARIGCDSLFARTALLEITETLGSVILAFALADTPEDIDSVFAAASLHESYQASQWGETDAFHQRQNERRRELNTALRFYLLSLP